MTLGASQGARVLQETHDFLGRFVAYPKLEAQVAHTLWIAHTHVMDVWESTPRLAALSPEPASGKTRLLEATELLVPRPVEAVNVTPSYLFRKVADPAGAPTILFDEIDTVFGPKAKDNEEIRGLLNAGHRRGAVAGRSIVRGKTVETEEIPAYCAVALAGLGNLPDTILSRSIVIRMRRRAPNEQVEPYRRRVHSPEGHAIRDRLGRWTTSAATALAGSWPTMPDSIQDRDADVWEPLLAIADAAGGTWPDTARRSAVALVAESKESTPSLGIRLLTDLKTIYRDEDHLATAVILNRLTDLDESPWGDMYGKTLDSRGLANRLRQYGITSKNIRVDGRVVKGYTREDLHDPWQRYLPTDPARRERASEAPSLPHHGPATSATPLQTTDAGAPR